MSSWITVNQTDLGETIEPGQLVEYNNTAYEYMFSIDNTCYLSPVQSGQHYESTGNTSSTSNTSSTGNTSSTTAPLSSDQRDIDESSAPKTTMPRKKRTYRKRKSVKTQENYRTVYSKEDDEKLLASWLIHTPRIGKDKDKWERVRDDVNDTFDYISVKRHLDKLITDRIVTNEKNINKSGTDEDEPNDFEKSLDDVIPVWQKANSKRPLEDETNAESIREAAMNTCSRKSPSVTPPSRSTPLKVDVYKLMEKREMREDKKIDLDNELLAIKKSKIELEVVKENNRMEILRKQQEQRDVDKLELQKLQQQQKIKLDEQKIKEKSVMVQLLTVLLEKQKVVVKIYMPF